MTLLAKDRSMRPLVTERPIRQIRLNGGRPCLDFVNTIHDRFALRPEDYLTTARRFFEWCEHARVLDVREASHCEESHELLSEVLTFREQLYALFNARIDGKEAPTEAVAELDRWLHRAWADLTFDPVAPGCLTWSAGALNGYLPLKRIALSALQLLRDGEPGRLKRCAAQDSCGWLFYDTTKNKRRRWCAMETCGTLVKMQRYRSH